MQRLLVGTLALAIAAVLASAGCEALVGDATAFVCSPGDPTSCAPGQVCSAELRCVSPCTETGCAGDQTCDPSTQLCTARDAGDDQTTQDAPDEDTSAPDVRSDVALDTNQPDVATRGIIGSPCLTTAQCNTGLFCADSSVLTAQVTNAAGPVCTQACCKSEDCPEGFACYGPGTGGNYCIRATLLQRGSATGPKTGGTPCGSSTECRSGVCIDANNTGAKLCADACCQDGPCPGGGVCGLAKIEGHLTMACTQPPAGGGATGAFCGGTSDCNNGLCVSSSCRARCCGKHTCPSNRACGYLSEQGATVQEYVPACISSFTGSGAVGAACSNPDGSECESGFCEVAAGKCTDVCCTDADCATYTGYTACRPDSNPNVHYLICSPP